MCACEAPAVVPTPELQPDHYTVFAVAASIWMAGRSPSGRPFFANLLDENHLTDGRESSCRHAAEVDTRTHPVSAVVAAVPRCHVVPRALRSRNQGADARAAHVINHHVYAGPDRGPLTVRHPVLDLRRRVEGVGIVLSQFGVGDGHVHTHGLVDHTGVARETVHVT